MVQLAIYSLYIPHETIFQRQTSLSTRTRARSPSARPGAAAGWSDDPAGYSHKVYGTASGVNGNLWIWANLIHQLNGVFMGFPGKRLGWKVDTCSLQTIINHPCSANKNKYADLRWVCCTAHVYASCNMSCFRYRNQKMQKSPNRCWGFNTSKRTVFVRDKNWDM